MLLSAEQWRKDFKVDEIVNSFEFKEKAEVDKYYPQFYHRTDKVNNPFLTLSGLGVDHKILIYPF